LTDQAEETELQDSDIRGQDRGDQSERTRLKWLVLGRIHDREDKLRRKVWQDNTMGPVLRRQDYENKTEENIQ
jgi:hypothetical protein